VLARPALLSLPAAWLACLGACAAAAAQRGSGVDQLSGPGQARQCRARCTVQPTSSSSHGGATRARLLLPAQPSAPLAPKPPGPLLPCPTLQDVYKTAEQIRAAGGTITREPGPVPGIGTKILACTDPDGYKIVFVDNEDFLKELQ
jgi:hypothetical protein